MYDADCVLYMHVHNSIAPPFMYMYVQCPASLVLQGAPEGILDRCKYVRVNGDQRIDLTEPMRQQILELVREYGTGQLL